MPEVYREFGPKIMEITVEEINAPPNERREN